MQIYRHLCGYLLEKMISYVQFTCERAKVNKISLLKINSAPERSPERLTLRKGPDSADRQFRRIPLQAPLFHCRTFNSWISAK